MKAPTSDPQSRAARLVRWYPREWRSRYGDEFSELLAAQIADQPQSWTRTLDVCLGAVMARLANLGLSGVTVEPSQQARRSLATLGCALAAFLTFALSIWAHLTVAWKRSAPATSATHRALIIMTVAVTICVAAAVAGSIPIAWSAIRAASRRSDPELRSAALLFLGATAILFLGAVAFHKGWPGVTGHPWARQSTGPGGPASFVWASTLTVSAYWAHPTILLNLPASELAWMTLNSIVLILSVVGAVKMIRRRDLSPGLLRFLRHTAQVATAGLGLFLLGALIWLVDGSSGPDDLFQAGRVVQVALVVMTAALIVAIRSLQRLRRDRENRFDPA